MQDFARSAGRLRRLPLGARVVYSVFLLFTLAGLALTAWLGGDMLGADLARLTNYYAGGAELLPAKASPADSSAAGPALELPDEVGGVVAEPMPLRKLLEVSHFHLFSMPVYLMVLCHLFMLCRWRERTKVVWVALATSAVAAHMLAPWLVRARSPGASAVYAVSGALLALTFGVMTVVPLWEMWTGARPASAATPR